MQRSKQLRVLVVDDYPDTAESVATCLSAAGLETRITRDGVEALEIANAWHPGVCVVDLTMPRFDGFELAQRLRSQGWSGRTVLIAHTGWTGEEMRKRAHAAGFDGYLTKPADPRDLLRMIEEKVKERIGQ